MPDEIKKIEIDQGVAKSEELNYHVPSIIQADTLFTFTSEIEFKSRLANSW